MEINEVIKSYPSKTAFCRAIGIWPQQLSQIERGDRPWPPKAALTIERLHGIPPENLRPNIFATDALPPELTKGEAA